MRIAILLILILLINSCVKKNSFYWGYVYHNNKPVVNVVVKQQNERTNNKAKTDSTGFFKLSKEPNSIGSLIFEKLGFISDTIPSIWIQHGEKVKYTFLNKLPDTIILRKDTSFLKEN